MERWERARWSDPAWRDGRQTKEEMEEDGDKVVTYVAVSMGLV